MLRHVSRRAMLLAAASLLPAALTLSKAVQAAHRPAPASEIPHLHLKLHTTRQSPTDLEISGVPRAMHTYLTRAELESLPQVSVDVTDHPDFPGQTTSMTGILLESLIQAIDAPPSDDVIASICADHYHSHFSTAYTQSHHPVLALFIEGQTPAQWAKSKQEKDPGPYLIVYDHFVPGSKILAHQEEPQIPVNVLELQFTSSSKLFGPIAPPADTLPNSPIQQGFAIAKENCLRCHATGAIGGDKSPVTWSAISSLAKVRPDIVSSYVHDPKSINPASTMPARPDYDAPTLAAINAYFQSLPKAPARRVTHE